LNLFSTYDYFTDLLISRSFGVIKVLQHFVTVKVHSAKKS